ncbi:MAG: hypothetical protein IBJ16_14165 [Chitinophagaceae bacterium]|nr:hypothetical protein [Chitinophagaceae bacterium]
MKNIILISLFITFTACSGSQVRSFYKTAGKKVASCCTSMSLKQRNALQEGKTVGIEENTIQQQPPAAIHLLEWNETVFIW